MRHLFFVLLLIFCSNFGYADVIESASEKAIERNITRKTINPDVGDLTNWESLRMEYVFYEGKNVIARQFTDMEHNVVEQQGVIPDGIVKEAFGDGQWIELNYLDNRLNGEEKKYYQDGSVWQIHHYVNGKFEGEMKTYFKNGVLQSQGTYKNNVQDQIWKIYYESGQIKAEVQYDSGNILHTRGFNEEGELTSEFDYSTGKPVKIK